MAENSQNQQRDESIRFAKTVHFMARSALNGDVSVDRTLRNIISLSVQHGEVLGCDVFPFVRSVESSGTSTETTISNEGTLLSEVEISNRDHSQETATERPIALSLDKRSTIKGKRSNPTQESTDGIVNRVRCRKPPFVPKLIIKFIDGEYKVVPPENQDLPKPQKRRLPSDTDSDNPSPNKKTAQVYPENSITITTAPEIVNGNPNREAQVDAVTLHLDELHDYFSSVDDGYDLFSEITEILQPDDLIDSVFEDNNNIEILLESNTEDVQVLPDLNDGFTSQTSFTSTQLALLNLGTHDTQFIPTPARLTSDAAALTQSPYLNTEERSSILQGLIENHLRLIERLNLQEGMEIMDVDEADAIIFDREEIDRMLHILTCG